MVQKIIHNFIKKNFYRIDAIGNIYVRDNVYVSCQECLLVYQNPHLDP